jgi:hypothetical protein
MTSKETITRAQTSSHLGETPSYEMGDIDVIRASGMAGQSNPLGLAIWRFRYCGDSREMPKIAQGLVDKGHDATVVVRVLHHLSDDVCKVCFGRGFGVVAGTPMLNGEECKDCLGAGRRLLEGEKEKALLEVIAGLERDIAGGIMRRLARELDL